MLDQPPYSGRVYTYTVYLDCDRLFFTINHNVRDQHAIDKISIQRTCTYHAMLSLASIFSFAWDSVFGRVPHPKQE